MPERRRIHHSRHSRAGFAFSPPTFSLIPISIRIVQHSFAFYSEHKDVIPAHVPIINTSKGLDTTSLKLMSELIPEALQRQQPIVVFSGPTFAKVRHT